MPHPISDQTPEVPNTANDIPKQGGPNNKDNDDNTGYTVDNPIERSVKNYVNEAKAV